MFKANILHPYEIHSTQEIYEDILWSQDWIIWGKDKARPTPSKVENGLTHHLPVQYNQKVN